MTLAAILEQAGFVPVVPAVSRAIGTAQTVTPQRVPVVPPVPARKQEGETETDAIRERLLTIAASEGLPASTVTTIPAGELHLYAELDDADLLLPLHLRARGLLCGEKNHHKHREHDHAQA